MEFLNIGQASFSFLILIFILSLTFLVLFGFVFFKEMQFSNLIIANTKIFYGQYSSLNLALNEISNNDYLPATDKSLTYQDINSYFSLPEINPEIKTISGLIATKVLTSPFEWKFNFTVEKDNQELKNLRIFILR